MATANSKHTAQFLQTDREKLAVSRKLVSDSIATGVIFALCLTVGQKIIGFARGILFCRFMTDQELGQWSMAWSSMMLLAPLAVLGLPGCFGRYTEFYRSRGQLKSFISRIAWISIVMTGLLAIAMISSPEWFSNVIFGSVEQVQLVLFLSGTIVIVTASNFLCSLMESLRQVRVVTAMRFVTGIVFAVAGVYLISTWENKAAAAATSYAVACLFGVLPAAWVFWKFRDVGFDSAERTHLPHKEMWKRIAPFALWLWASNFCHNFFEVSDRYMLIHWSSESYELAQGFVGQYHSGRVVPLLLVSVATMLGGVLMPYMSAHWEAGRKDKAIEQLNWTVKLMSISFTAGSVLVLLFSPVLFDWILQGRYNDGLRVLPLTLVYCIWFCLFVVGQDYLWTAEKGKWAAFSIFVGLVVNIVLNMLLIPHMGLTGAVVATTLGNAINVVMIFGFNHLFGCRINSGILLCALTPLVLLANPWLSALAIVLIALLTWKTNWFFTDSEKEAVVESCGRRVAKLKQMLG
jgi:O-antigen/teichoic acid export membrane protein